MTALRGSFADIGDWGSQQREEQGLGHRNRGVLGGSVAGAGKHGELG